MYIAKTDEWYLERLVWLVAGIIALVSISLAVLVSIYWLLLVAFMGVSLIIFSLTGFCLMANILYKLGAKPRLQK